MWTSLFSLILSQSCCRSQTRFVPPHKVPVPAVLHWAVSESGSSIRAEGQAEPGGAVADLEQTVRPQERISFASSEVIHCLQVVINSNIAQVLPALHPPPPPPQEDDASDQNQNQDGQDARDRQGGGRRLGGLTQSRFKTGLQCELTAGPHEAFGALTYRAGEVGEARTAVLARPGPAGVGAHRAVLAGVSQGAGAGVVVHTILARPSVLTWT